jgi:hypothetical protein
VGRCVNPLKATAVLLINSRYSAALGNQSLLMIKKNHPLFETGATRIKQAVPYSALIALC